MAATLATGKGSPLGILPSLISTIVLGLTRKTALAVAERSVFTLFETSLIQLFLIRADMTALAFSMRVKE
jgi:hypothetical protein